MRKTGFLLGSVLFATACGIKMSGNQDPFQVPNPNNDNPHNHDMADPQTEESAGGSISIYIKGDLTPKTFNDGLSSQTPKDYFIAISKYYVQTSLNDPSPVLCFDHGEQLVLADMSKDNLVGACDTETIPTAIYTHGRTKVEWAKFTVSGTLHHLGQTYAGDFTFFHAYSDTNYQGKSYWAGHGTVAFKGEFDVEIPITFFHPPTVQGMKSETINGEFWTAFPYSHGLFIDQKNQEAHWARFNWEIYEGFRWSDIDTPTYTDNDWDVNSGIWGSETVLFNGVTGYHVTSSID